MPRLTTYDAKDPDTSYPPTRTVRPPAGAPNVLIVQVPYEGVSMAETFASAEAPERHETQSFQMFVNRGIYHQGWTAVTCHSMPWVVVPLPGYDDDRWELYGPDDWTQARDLAAEQPWRLAQLQRLSSSRPPGTTSCPR